MGDSLVTPEGSDSVSLATAKPGRAPAPVLETTPALSPTITINLSSRASLSRTSMSVERVPSMLCLTGLAGGSSPSYMQSCLERAQFEHGRVNLSHLIFLLRQATHGLGKGGGPPASVSSSEAIPMSCVLHNGNIV